MLIYILYYIFILLVFVVNKRLKCKTLILLQSSSCDFIVEENQKKTKRFTILAFAGLILIFGLRHPTMGIDLDNYLPAYDVLNKFDWGKILTMGEYIGFEKGFMVLNKIIGGLGFSSQAFLFICAALSLFPIAYIISKYSDNPLTSILIYLGLPVFLIVFSTLRQAIAVGMTFASFDFIKKKKLLPFVLITCLASLIHSSAIIFLVAYPLYHIKLPKPFVLISILVLPLIYILRYPLFSVASLLFKPNAIPDNNGAITLFLVFVAIYVFCVYFGDKKDRLTTGLLNLFWVACAVQAMGGVYSTALRVGYYFIVYLTILLPRVFSNIIKTKKGIIRIVVPIVIVAFVAFGIYSIRTASWPESYPYIFFWEIK